MEHVQRLSSKAKVTDDDYKIMASALDNLNWTFETTKKGQLTERPWQLCEIPWQPWDRVPLRNTFRSSLM